MWIWFLDHVPHWFRTRWPMKRFYWQEEELETARKLAEELFGSFRH